MMMSRSKAALLIVDIQEDFCEPSGTLALKGGRELATNVNSLLDLPGFALKLAARDFHPVDHISFVSQHPGATPFTYKTTIKNPENESETHTSAVFPAHCVQGTSGCEIIPEIHQHKLDAVIEKGWDKRLESFSAFGPPFRNPAVYMTKLDEMLKQAKITHVFCVGISFNVCVFHSATDAAEFGYKAFVIEDASASRQTGEELATTRKAYKEKGVDVIDMSSKELDIARSTSSEP